MDQARTSTDPSWTAPPGAASSSKLGSAAYHSLHIPTEEINDNINRIAAARTEGLTVWLRCTVMVILGALGVFAVYLFLRDELGYGPRAELPCVLTSCVVLWIAARMAATYYSQTEELQMWKAERALRTRDANRLAEVRNYIRWLETKEWLN